MSSAKELIMVVKRLRIWGSNMNAMKITDVNCLFTNYCAERQRVLELGGDVKMDFKIKYYRCKTCGKVLIVVNDTNIPTVCCGEIMEELIPCTTDGAVEKHVPVIHQSENKVIVTVGQMPHPMTKEHYIMWIVLLTDKGIQKKFLCPGDVPSAEFLLLEDESIISAYAYCNLHQLWKDSM